MTSHSFQILSDKEVIDMKRSRGIMACAECQRRKLKCDKKFPCSSCVRRGRADICPTGDMGFIGRGRRIMRSESMELSTTIHNMGDRIQQLESAVAQAHADASDSPHPLLRDDLLGIKFTGELSRSSTDPTPAQQANTAGALAVGASGTSRYYGFSAGPSAFLSVQGSNGGDRAEYAPPFADTIRSFALDGIHSFASWDTELCVETLLDQLPDELRAWALYDIFVADASWYGTPVLPDELHELLSHLYDPEAPACELSPHGIAVVFMAFAHGALADLALPPYNAEADTYFDLARTALALQSIFDSKDLHTIQALALSGLYYSAGGARYSIESAWTITSMAVGLCQTLRLHRESAHTCFNNKTAQRRRALFWEMYSLETYQSLSFSRPLTIPLADISCEFPADLEQTIDGKGTTIPGFWHTKWNFTKEVTAPMAQAYTSAKSPSYEEVLDLDRRLRRFMETAPFPHYAEQARQSGAFLAYVRANMIPRFAANLMVYVHRSSFVQALKDRPLNPLDGPYAASFLAAYRSASFMIKSDMRSFSLFPDHYHRWWPIWKSLVNASFIVGSIAAKSPQAVMANVAFSELLYAVELVERGATHSFLAAGSLPVLRRLRNKAETAIRPLAGQGQTLHSENPFDLADEKDFALLSGSHAILDRNSVPNSNPMSRSRCIPSTGVAIPSLIPSVMPPPPPPTPPTHDLWPTDQEQDQNGYGWLNIQLEPIPEACMTPVKCGDVAAAGLEAYMSAQMQYPYAYPSYRRQVEATPIPPTEPDEWSNFLRLFEH